MTIKVINAVYGGNNGKSKDVTEIVQSFVNSGKTTFTVDNQTMGGDPDFGVVKKFQAMYLPQGEMIPKNVEATEGQKVTL